MKSIDKSILGMVSESSGCNESERIGDHRKTRGAELPGRWRRQQEVVDRAAPVDHKTSAVARTQSRLMEIRYSNANDSNHV